MICDRRYFQLERTYTQILFGLNSYLFSIEVDNVCVIGKENDIATEYVFNFLDDNPLLHVTIKVYYYKNKESENDVLRKEIKKNCNFIVNMLNFDDTEKLFNDESLYSLPRFHMNILEQQLLSKINHFKNDIIVGEGLGQFSSMFVRIVNSVDTKVQLDFPIQGNPDIMYDMLYFIFIF